MQEISVSCVEEVGFTGIRHTIDVDLTRANSPVPSFRFAGLPVTVEKKS